MRTDRPTHVEVHHHVHYDDPRIDEILRLVRRIHHQEETQMADLSALKAEVGENTEVTTAVSTLVARLADEIEAAGGDQEAIDDLVATLRANDSGLADLVVANTPAVSESPPAEEPVDPNEPRPA